MYLETINHFAQMAEKKANLLKNNPLSFYIGALMAGAYVGMGIVLIFVLGAHVDPSIRPLVMGATFGIALTLVVFAGSELFTGHTMYMTIGWLQDKVSGADVFKAWGASWLGNLIGAIVLAVMVAIGDGPLFNGSSELLNTVAGTKMNKGPIQLFFLAILCNWLVCLALWTSARTQNDAAKCILIFWCLLAFIASGFEHSVANMTVFSLALLGEHPDAVSLPGMFYNLTFVTLGNTVAGSLFMAIGYWAATPNAMAEASEPAKKIKIILDGLFNLGVTVASAIKRIAQFIVTAAQKKLQGNDKAE